MSLSARGSICVMDENAINKRIYQVYTYRDGKIRIITARDMSRKERREYEKKIQTNTKV